VLPGPALVERCFGVVACIDRSCVNNDQPFLIVFESLHRSSLPKKIRQIEALPRSIRVEGEVNGVDRLARTVESLTVSEVHCPHVESTEDFLEKGGKKEVLCQHRPLPEWRGTLHTIRIGLSAFSLESLDISGDKVTDAGLRELKSIKTLKKLDAAFIKGTKAGFKELQGALPGLKLKVIPELK